MNKTVTNLLQRMEKKDYTKRYIELRTLFDTLVPISRIKYGHMTKTQNY